MSFSGITTTLLVRNGLPCDSWLTGLAGCFEVLLDDRPKPDQHVSVGHLDVGRRDLFLELLKERARLIGGHGPGSLVPHALTPFCGTQAQVGARKPASSQSVPGADDGEERSHIDGALRPAGQPYADEENR